MKTLTYQRLRELLSYDAETGVFTWLVNRRGHTKAGDVAGKSTTQAYVSIRLDGEDYLAHRLAFLFVTGGWPTEQVDHINGTRSDNSFLNLRDVSGSVNQQNRRRASCGKQAPLGAYWIGNNSGKSPSGAWHAQIRVSGRLKNIGRFKTAEEAGAAYIAAKRQLHAGCTI